MQTKENELDDPFDIELTALLVKHDYERVYGVPTHIIKQIMLSSFYNYRTIFKNLEEFYMQLESEKEAHSSFIADTESEPYASDRELPPHMD